ncbi:MAG: T9SS type A sorting domain-containing protein [Caldithrix sp.]|nr:T9SS type A sorting domain-containing protein [Caldithrix sp.]
MQAIGIDVWNGSTAQVQSFKNDTGIKYPLLMNGSNLQSPYGVYNDYSMVIDQDGIVQYKGADVALNDIRSAIDQSLATSLDSDETKKLSFELHGNYPNPFNPQTQISFTVNRKSRIQLQIFDVQGRFIRNLLNQQMPVGQHSIKWDGRTQQGNLLPSGFYIYRLKSAMQNQSKRMLLIR